MANKEKIELYYNATIAQKGTESEKKALIFKLKSQSSENVFDNKETSIEKLWQELKNINLADAKVRAEIIQFITNERKSTGGHINSEMERRFTILEKNIGFANVVDEKKAKQKTQITAETTHKKNIIKQEVQSSTNRVDASNIVGKQSRKPSSTGNSPQPSQEINSNNYEKDLESIKTHLEAWRMAVERVNTHSDKSDHMSNALLIDEQLKVLSGSMMEFYTKYIAEKDTQSALQNSEYLKSINNEIALYLRGKGKLKNSNFKNPMAAEAMLKGILEKKIKTPTFPTQQELLSKIDTSAKVLIKTLLDAKIKQGMSYPQALGETLRHPSIKGIWDQGFTERLKKYETDMVVALNTADISMLTSQEKESLDQLKDMYGTTSWYDLKDANETKLALVVNGILSAGMIVVGGSMTTAGLGLAGTGFGALPIMIGATSATTGLIGISEVINQWE